MILHAGTAQDDITPPLGLELAGYDFGPAESVLDALMAQALFLRSGRESVVIVTADLLGIGVELVRAVRSRVAQEIGIPGERVLLAASHTHSGPATMYLRHWGTIDPAYLQTVENKLVGLVHTARRNLQEARAGTKAGAVDNISENRRLGQTIIDPAVPVLRIDDAHGRPLAIFYTFGCHPVTLHSYRNLISPDYPGYARGVIRSVLGQEVCVLFALGPAGDINPKGYEHLKTTPARAQQIGEILGCEVAKIALGIDTQAALPVQAGSRETALPLVPLPPKDELVDMIAHYDAECRKRAAQDRPRWEVSEAAIRRDWAKEALSVLESGTVESYRACELQAFSLGKAAFIAMPLEVFTETGLAVKAASPFATTFIVSNANGTLGYVPVSQAYTVRDYTNPQGLAPKVIDLYAFAEEAESQIVRESTQMLRVLYGA